MSNTDNAMVSPVAAFAGNLPAKLIANGLNINALRQYDGMKANGMAVNALLRKNEWEVIDQTVVDIARTRLVGIADLRQRGLVQNLGGLGSIVSTYETISDMSDANISMDGTTAGDEDTVAYTPVSVPVPIIHKDFRISLRRLLASRNIGDALDVTQVATATRKVAEQLESILFNGLSFAVDGSSVYGYTTHPNRNTGSASDFGTSANVFTSINAMVSAAEADGFYGPYVLYVASTQYGEMRIPYTDGSGQSPMTRVLELMPQIEAIQRSYSLAAGNVVLVNMSRETVDLALAQDITAVEWNTMGGMVSHFKVMTAAIPRVKADNSGASGIVHYTGA